MKCLNFNEWSDENYDAFAQYFSHMNHSKCKKTTERVLSGVTVKMSVGVNCIRNFARNGSITPVQFLNASSKRTNNTDSHKRSLAFVQCLERRVCVWVWNTTIGVMCTRVFWHLFRARNRRVPNWDSILIFYGSVMSCTTTCNCFTRIHADQMQQHHIAPTNAPNVCHIPVCWHLLIMH